MIYLLDWVSGAEMLLEAEGMILQVGQFQQQTLEIVGLMEGTEGTAELAI